MRTTRRGYIFVQTLVVVAVLVALMAMLVADQHATLAGVQTRLRTRRAEAAADAAVARALSVLSAADADTVQQTDEWALQGGANGADEFEFSDKSADFRVQIVDTSGLLNINTATAAQLQLLPITQDQVDSLLDWRETGTQPRADGAKDEYYNALTQPYNTKLGPLSTVDELLLVKGWTGATLYQPPLTATGITAGLQMPTGQTGDLLPLASLLTVDSGTPNTRSDGSARINLGQRGGNTTLTALSRLGVPRPLAARLSQSTYTSFANLEAVPGMNPPTMRLLLDAVTFTPATRLQGKINLNTATQAVLETVPTMTQDVAGAIVAQQPSGFATLSALADVTGITPARLGALADNFTVGSDTWLVRAYGESGGVGVAVEATVGLRNGQAQVINWNRLNTTTVPTWWDWDAQVSTTLDAGATL